MSDRKLYRDAGVDVEQGDKLVSWLQQTGGGETVTDDLAGLGGFAGMFRPRAWQDMTDPVLVAATDGVGTKLLMGLATNRLGGLGQDLVAMCVNDLYTIGAVPWFFLDYFATGALDATQFKTVLSGIKESLNQVGAVLLGGETAELPGLYRKGHFDIAGFVVGAVDAAKRLGPHRVGAGDVLISFASSGFHSNGYSLLRRWLGDNPPAAYAEKLLVPTKIYRELPELCQEFPEALRAAAHITGGGISGNLVRVLPQGLMARISRSALPIPEWVSDLYRENGVDFTEIEGVFNNGCGMICAVAAQEQARFCAAATKLGLQPTYIGDVRPVQGAAHVAYCD